MTEPDIPPFGDWETTGNTPYTQRFEGARKNKKTGTPSHPNDPGRHPEPPHKSPLNQSGYKPDPRDQGLKNPPNARKPETDQRQFSEHSTHRESAPRRPANPQRVQGGNGNTPRSPYNRASAGSALPMEQNNQARPKNKSTGMQTPDRRASSEGHGQHTPGRGRMTMSGHGYEPEEVVVPPFGDWDDANAESGEKYTRIFNKVRDNRLSPPPSIGQPPTAQRQDDKVKQVCPCSIL